MPTLELRHKLLNAAPIFREYVKVTTTRTLVQVSGLYLSLAQNAPPDQ